MAYAYDMQFIRRKCKFTLFTYFFLDVINLKQQKIKNIQHKLILNSSPILSHDLCTSIYFVHINGKT